MRHKGAINASSLFYNVFSFCSAARWQLIRHRPGNSGINRLLSGKDVAVGPIIFCCYFLEAAFHLENRTTGTNCLSDNVYLTLLTMFPMCYICLQARIDIIHTVGFALNLFSD